MGVMLKSGRVEEYKSVRVGWRLKMLGIVVGILKWGGTGLMMLAVFGGWYIYWPLLVSNLKFEILNQSQSSNFKIQNRSDRPAWEVPDWSYSIYIPKIGAVSRVIPDVSVVNKKEYLKALKRGVAEAAGLAHPGEAGTTFLFAHSVGDRLDYARYNAVFYLLNKLEVGDGVEVVYKSKLYRYKVAEVQKLGAKDTRYLRPQSEEEILVLQTCWPPGTTWGRLVVVALPFPS